MTESLKFLNGVPSNNAFEALKKINENRHFDALAENMELTEKSQKTLRESLINNIKTSGKKPQNRIITEAKLKAAITESLFIRSIGRIFIESTPLDDHVKMILKDKLHNFNENTIKTLMKQGKLDKNGILNEATYDVAQIYRLCEEYAVKEIQYRKMNGITLEEGDIELSDQTKSDFQALSQDSQKEIIDVITKKVIDTVSAEVNKSKESDTQDDKIQQQTGADVNGEPPAVPAGNDQNGDQGAGGEGDMGGGDMSGGDGTDQGGGDAGGPPEFSMDDNGGGDQGAGDNGGADNGSAPPPPPANNESFDYKNFVNDSLFNDIHKVIYKKSIKESFLNETGVPNRENIFADAIITYSFLETMNVLGLLRCPAQDVRSFKVALSLLK